MKQNLPSTFFNSLLGPLGLITFLTCATTRHVGAQSVPGEMIDIGGYRAHLVCVGEGSPTVLLDSGAGTGGWSARWVAVLADLADQGLRACTWDRPGLGLSDAGPLPRTSGQIVVEMKALIRAADLETPVVLAGHSFGGQNVRLFAATHPEMVAGVVLIDAGHEEQWNRLDPAIWEAVQGQALLLQQRADAIRDGAGAPPSSLAVDQLPPVWREAAAEVSEKAQHYEGVANELASIPESNAQLAQADDLGDIPLLVLTAGRSFYAFEGTLDTDIAAANDTWLALQQDLVQTSSRGQQIVVPKADHHLVSTHPRLVANHIATFARGLP